MKQRMIVEREVLRRKNNKREKKKGPSVDVSVPFRRRNKIIKEGREREREAIFDEV